MTSKIIKREKNVHPVCESNSEDTHQTRAVMLSHSAEHLLKRTFDRLPKIDLFLKFFISYSITGLSYSENSNGHNSAHILPIWMNYLSLYSLRECLSTDAYFVSGHGHDPG